MTHFTLVSYKDEIPCGEKSGSWATLTRAAPTSGTHLRRARASPTRSNDWGTFDKGRAALYGFVAAPQTVRRGHHGPLAQKGIVFPRQGQLDGDTIPEPKRTPCAQTRTTSTDAASKIGSCTPILVSDCGGPLPRLNLEDEFVGWGSDTPSGTLMTVSPEGTVTKIEVVPSAVAHAKPRLAVALDYLHVMKDQVFDKIEVAPFDRAEAETAEHEITFTFHKKFPDEIAKCLDVVLFGRPTLEYRWRKIVLEPSTRRFKAKEYKPGTTVVAKPAELTLAVPKGQAREFYEWLALGPRSGRFVSFGFGGTKYFDKIYDTQSRWNFAVEAKPSLVSNSAGVRVVERQSYEIMPRGTGDGGRAERGLRQECFALRRPISFGAVRPSPRSTETNSDEARPRRLGIAHGCPGSSRKGRQGHGSRPWPEPQAHRLAGPMAGRRRNSRATPSSPRRRHVGPGQAHRDQGTDAGVVVQRRQGPRPDRSSD
jgi:hypothetical protein